MSFWQWRLSSSDVPIHNGYFPVIRSTGVEFIKLLFYFIVSIFIQAVMTYAPYMYCLTYLGLEYIRATSPTYAQRRKYLLECYLGWINYNILYHLHS